MDTYGTILIVLHVVGAVAGLGPSFAFGVLGPLSAKLGGPQGLGILEGMHAMESKIVLPTALTLQPITGVLMIFHFHFAKRFFHNTWLLASLGAYVIILVLAIGVNNPAIARMISLAKGGKADTPEFQSSAKTAKTLGPVFGILLLFIVVMMVWRPGLSVA
ncbi:MAG: DUF2269 family protein [Actinomycetota bacterium]